jgi:hypothetical protein
MQQHVPIVPGTVVKVEDGGMFVFLGEEGTEMILSAVGEDEEGDIVPAGDGICLHVDFRDSLTPTSIRANLYG